MSFMFANHHVNTLTSQMRVEQMLPIVDLIQMKRMKTIAWIFELETAEKKFWSSCCLSL